MKNPLFINKNVWNPFDEMEMENYVQSVVDYYIEHGFPFFDDSMEYRKNEYRKLVAYDDSNIIEDGVIKQTMHGLGLAWSYHPHSWDIPCNNSKTPMWAFKNRLKGVIKKRIRMGDNMSDNGLRKMLKMFTGVQSVSNFRPTAASAIYKRYGSGKILDMSAGFGGRMLGAMKAEATQYTYFEPSSKTFIGLENMRSDFMCKKVAHIGMNRGSEIRCDKIPIMMNHDIAFTSPPYYSQEIYADEKTQSCVKYPEYEQWIDGFLRPMMNNTSKMVKDSGTIIVNIANVSSAPNLEQDFLSVAKDVGLELKETLKLSLSNSVFKKGKCAYKYEPVFVFTKR